MEMVSVAVSVVTFLALHTTIVLSELSPVLQGELVDTDGYTQSLRLPPSRRRGLPPARGACRLWGWGGCC
jgi:hypothetical protein